MFSFIFYITTMFHFLFFTLPQCFILFFLTWPQCFLFFYITQCFHFIFTLPQYFQFFHISTMLFIYCCIVCPVACFLSSRTDLLCSSPRITAREALSLVTHLVSYRGSWKQNFIFSLVHWKRSLTPRGKKAMHNDTGFLLDQMWGLDCHGRYLSRELSEITTPHFA